MLTGPKAVLLVIVQLALVLTTAACQEARPPDAVHVGFNEETPLVVEQEAFFGDDFRLTLSEVKEDDRCPPGAVCDEEGSADIRFEVEPLTGYMKGQITGFAADLGGGDSPVSFFLVSSDIVGIEQPEDYRFTVGLCPYPDAEGREMPAQDKYELHIMVKKVTGNPPYGSESIHVPCAGPPMEA